MPEVQKPFREKHGVNRGNRLSDTSTFIATQQRYRVSIVLVEVRLGVRAKVPDGRK